MPALRVYLLGPLDLRLAGQPLPKPPTLKSQSLLAYLALHRENPQPRDRLIDLFWGDRPEPKARHSLRTALWHIRRCLPEEHILSDPHTVQFEPQADLWLDVDEFESWVSHGDIARLESGVALYRGDFLDGFYDEWVINERYRLETLFCEALARLMLGQETAGQHDGALATAVRLLDQNPLREDAHRLTMRVHCRLGQRNAALEQYRRCQGIVQEELGAEPMAETTALYREIMEGRFVVEEVAEDVPVGVPAARPTLGRNPLEVVTTSKLVGREEELAFLDECWQGAEAGQGGLVLISGEAGVGKTRLVEELANRLRWQGVRVLWGRCYEFERVLPYQPVTEALRTVVSGLSASDWAGFPASALAEVARLVPEVLHEPALSSVEERTELEVTGETDWGQERTRLFEGVTRFLAESSSEGPLLIVLEDLHWASEPTLQLVHYLARHLAEHHVLMVGTFRSEEVGLDHPLRVLRRRLTRERVAKPLRLSRLSSDAVEALVMEMSGAGEAVLPLARRLHKETDGNPFFLMEIVKALFETDALCVEEGVWQGGFDRMSEEELPLPAAMSEAIQTRAHRLDEASQEALRLAAVLGREFDFDLLKSVWGRGEESLLVALGDLLRRRLIEEGSGAMARDYAFAHHKIQEVVYSAMTRRHRLQTHARVATAMESIFGTAAEEVAGELAFHFLQGAQHDETLTQKAITYLLLAGDRARTLYAHQEAIDHYQTALGLLKEQGEYARAARTLMKLGLTCDSAFDFKQAHQAYEEGFALWQRAGAMQPVVIAPLAPHALRVVMFEPRTLDPSRDWTWPSAGATGQLFSGLVELTPELGVVPDVARSWEVLEGGRKYIFHLRDDVRWSDGVEVTAGDFEYAWKRVLDPAYGLLYAANSLYDIKKARAFHQGEMPDPDMVGVHAVDGLTLMVELEGPIAYFIHLLTSPTLTMPVPRHVVEAHGAAWTELSNIVTNGPFRLVTWERGETMVLERNRDYHGRFAGNLERVEYSLISGQTTRLLQMYEGDDLDVLDMNHLSPAEWNRGRQRHAGEYVSGPQLSVSLIGFDVTRPPFDDPRVRRAFSLATDREALAHVTLRGYVFAATGGLVPPGMAGHSPDIGLPYDPEGARRLLAEAGYPGGRGFPAIDCLGRDNPVDDLVREYLHAQWWENLGVEIAWKKMAFRKFVDSVRRETPHMWTMEWGASYPDPDDLLRFDQSFLPGGWQNEVYDRLVEGARRVADQRERMSMYQQAEQILVEEVPVLPLYYGRLHLLMKPWVRRYPMSLLNMPLWKDVIIEPH